VQPGCVVVRGPRQLLEVLNAEVKQFTLNENNYFSDVDIPTNIKDSVIQEISQKCTQLYNLKSTKIHSVTQFMKTLRLFGYNHATAKLMVFKILQMQGNEIQIKYPKHWKDVHKLKGDVNCLEFEVDQNSQEFKDIG
jgi:hypothetical protein